MILKEYIAFLKMIGSYGADWLAEFFGAALEMGQGENVVYNLWKLLESDIQVTDVVEMFRKTQMALIHDAKTKGKFAKIWVTAIRRLPENARPMIMMHDKYVTESNILLKLPPREYYEVCFRHMADYEKLTICAFCPECKIWHPATVDYFKYRSLVPLGAKGTCARCKKEIMNVTDNVDFIGTNAMPKGGGREEIRYRLAVFGPQPPADKR